MFEYNKQYEVNKNLQDSIGNSKRITENFNEFLKEAREMDKEFFYQIVILCTALIGLSVTFIGYANKTNEIIFIQLLYFSWFSITLALISALFRNFVYTKFGHWQINKERIKSLLEVEKNYLELGTNYPNQILNINTKDELDKYIKTLKQNIKRYEEGLNYNTKKEKINQIMWQLTEITATYGIIFGIITLIIFVGINI